MKYIYIIHMLFVLNKLKQPDVTLLFDRDFLTDHMVYRERKDLVAPLDLKENQDCWGVRDLTACAVTQESEATLVLLACSELMDPRDHPAPL